MSSPELTEVGGNDIEVISNGTIELIGRMPWSSNATFLAEAVLNDTAVRVIYKPHAGERPLWDFPDGLWKREVAAFELSDVLGWDIVPFTIARDDAPHDIGSVQRYIEADFGQHYFTMIEDEATHDQLRRFAVFDFISNNTDRKGGHCLIDADGHIWGIDNGLSFHADFKLRTVIWDFGGEEIADATLTDLDHLIETGLPDAVASLLGVFERDAILARAKALLRNGVLPIDESGQRYPWPLV